MKNLGRKKGSSLITTLLVLVVLSIIVIAFLQSMAVERMTARSAKSAFCAQLAAEAGLADAANRLADLMTANPYHAIGYTNHNGQILTILAGSASGTSTAQPTRYFLLSGSNPASAPPALNVTNSVAINIKSAGESGWVGSPVNSSGTLTYRECRAPWIYILKNPSQPHQSDPSLPSYNPYVGRYAYWVEDETSKIDFRVAGNTNGASGAFLRGTNISLPQDVDMGALPVLNGKAVPTNNFAANTQLITFRDTTTNLPVDGRAIGQVSDLSTNSVETARFYVTMASYANDLAGSGQKRVNLNALVTDTTDAEKIKSDMDDIAWVITGSHIYPGLNNATVDGNFHNLSNTNGPLPAFGARFFGGGAVDAANQTIYLKKIAANIRDYIDTDSVPTMVDRTGNVRTGNPSSTWWNEWPPQALGKEAIPYLQETAWAGNIVSWSATGGTRTATIEIDHYLEFFNPSTKDFTAPAGTKITLSDLGEWTAGAFPSIDPADCLIDISGVQFPAGKVTVITTNPGADVANLIQDASRVVRKQPIDPATTRRFENRNTTENTNLGGIGFKRISRSSSVSDTAAHLMFSGSSGVYDALPSYGYTGANGAYFDFVGGNSAARYVYSASLMGNSANGRTGDPRTLSEQLDFNGFNSGNQDNTRFYGNIQGNGGIPNSATFGKAALIYVDPTKSQGSTGAWPDYNPAFNDTPGTAYAVIADGPMNSIGELGNIFDPLRVAAPSGINSSRGGGRSLKIGQPDDVYGGAIRFSAEWQKSAWRLTDVFGTGTNRTLVELDPVSRGKVNINSVARDDGTVLKALLRKFEFLATPGSDANLSGKLVSDADAQNLITSIKSYLTSNGPMMERGELSQISFFSGAAGNSSTVAAKLVRDTNDRGREEIFRRLVELITTRSSAFSIYSVGEALQETANGKIKVLARSKEGYVYRFDPVIGSNPRDKVTGFQYQKVYEIQ